MKKMQDWPHDRSINRICLGRGDGWESWISVGFEGVTRIEQTEKHGEYAMIPYVRAWKGEIPFAEFCQHKLFGIYYSDGGDNP